MHFIIYILCVYENICVLLQALIQNDVKDIQEKRFEILPAKYDVEEAKRKTE